MTNMGRFGTDYQTRAFTAYAGLGALSSADALYPTAFVDGDGNALDAAYKYVIRFPKDGLPPSASNVWSISSLSRELLRAQFEIDRYGILSSMPLKFNADGSLDIYVQATSPGPERESELVARARPAACSTCPPCVYQPKKELLDGSYVLPPVVKVAS